MSLAGSVSPAVLKNRGVPMVVHAVVHDGDDLPTAERILDSAGEFVMEAARYIKFDNNTLSDIEDADLGWGSVDAWEEQLVVAPFSTVRATLAMCWGFDPKSRADLRVVGAMCPDATEEVGTLIGAAYMLANGMDPQLVGEAIRRSEIELAAEAKATQARLAESLKAAEETTTGEDASPTSPSDDTPTVNAPPDSADTLGTSGSEHGSSPDAILTSSGV